MRINEEQLIQFSVAGKAHHPTSNGGYRVGSDGIARVIPAVGGITYNKALGDCCMGLAGDHVEPGVSMKNSDSKEDAALQQFACVGNTAKVISGEASGSLGFVSGKHGGIDHVMCYFAAEVLEKMAPDDRILIRAYGQGLRLLDYPDIVCMNLDPVLLMKLGIKEENNQLVVPVAAIIPACLMGSGLGSPDMHSGDYDIMTHDKKKVLELGLHQLRFGDIVLIQDHSCVYGADYMQGASTVGVIVHSDSFTAGHGPGVTVLLTSKLPMLQPRLDKTANLAHYFQTDEAV